MSYLSNVLARAVSVAAVAAFAVLVALVALMSLFVPGCASFCSCPGGGGGSTTVQIAPAQSSPIVDVVTNDRGCTAAASGTDSVYINRMSAGACNVQARLENGDTYGLSITVQLENIQGACDCSRLIISNQSGPTLVSTGDGGTD
jgi:hypothetical protein